MRRLLLAACLLTLAVPSSGQELPRVTEEGKRAVLELLIECTNTGAIKLVRDPSGAERIVLADEQKLREVVKQRRNKITPALRDALLRYHEQPGAVALLQVIG